MTKDDLLDLLENNITDPQNKQNTAARVREVFEELMESCMIEDGSNPMLADLEFTLNNTGIAWSSASIREDFDVLLVDSPDGDLMLQTGFELNLISDADMRFNSGSGNILIEGDSNISTIGFFWDSGSTINEQNGGDIFVQANNVGIEAGFIATMSGQAINLMSLDVGIAEASSNANVTIGSFDGSTDIDLLGELTLALGDFNFLTTGKGIEFVAGSYIKEISGTLYIDNSNGRVKVEDGTAYIGDVLENNWIKVKSIVDGNRVDLQTTNAQFDFANVFNINTGGAITWVFGGNADISNTAGTFDIQAYSSLNLGSDTQAISLTPGGGNYIYSNGNMNFQTSYKIVDAKGFSGNGAGTETFVFNNANAIYMDATNGYISFNSSDTGVYNSKLELSPIYSWFRYQNSAGGATSQLQLEDDQAFLQFNDAVSVLCYLQMDYRGLGIQTKYTSGYYAFLRADNLTSDFTYQFPAVNGTILTTGGTDSDTITGDLEFDFGKGIIWGPFASNASVKYDGSDVYVISGNDIYLNPAGTIIAQGCNLQMENFKYIYFGVSNSIRDNSGVLEIDLPGASMLVMGTTVISQGTLGNKILGLTSTATSDDPVVNYYQNRVATTDATVTTIHTITTQVTTTTYMEGLIICRRTGGSAGTAEDGAAYRFVAVVKNVAGTATIINSSITVVGEDQAGWDVTLSPSASNILIRVTGAVDNNITWHLSELKISTVTS